MTPALQEVIERLRQMSPERQDAFARLLLREILADEQWMRSTQQAAEWREQQRQQSQSASIQKSQQRQQQAQARANEPVPSR